MLDHARPETNIAIFWCCCCVFLVFLLLQDSNAAKSIPVSLLKDRNIRYITETNPRYSSSATQGGGGSFKNRKPIGEVGCCESRMAEQIHWWTKRWLKLCFLEWLQWLQWSPHPQLLREVWCSAVVVVVVVWCSGVVVVMCNNCGVVAVAVVVVIVVWFSLISLVYCNLLYCSVL